MKRCLISLVIRKMQTETTMRYHYTPARMVKIKKKQVLTKMLSNWNSRTLLAEIWNGTATSENHLAVSYKVKLKSTIRPRNPIPRYLPKRNKNTCLHKPYKQMFTACLLMVAPNWKQIYIH